jgi:hypothetical protein
MSSIEEQRNKAIAEQIRKMAGMEPEETKTPQVPPPKVRQEKPPEKLPEKAEEKQHETVSLTVDFEAYQKNFLNPLMIENRVSFSLNRDTLDLFRHILHDLRSKTTLSAYIENILREHLARHKETLGKAIEKNRRKSIIP